MGRRWISPHGRPSSIKRLQIHPNCKTGIQAPFKFSSPLHLVPYPSSPVLCSLSASLVYICPQSPYPEGFFSPLHTMSNASFRLESFRPWNSFQDKAQPLRDSRHLPLPKSSRRPPPRLSPILSSRSQRVKKVVPTNLASIPFLPALRWRSAWMAVYIRTHKPLDTSLRIRATPPPDLTLRLSTEDYFAIARHTGPLEISFTTSLSSVFL